MPSETKAQPKTRPCEVVGRNVRIELLRRGMQQAVLADPLNVVRSAVSHRLTGRTPLDVNELVVVATFLGVPIATLLDGVEVPDLIRAPA